MMFTIIKSLTAEREVGGLCEILKIVAMRVVAGHSKLFYEIELNWDLNLVHYKDNLGSTSTKIHGIMMHVLKDIF